MVDVRVPKPVRLKVSQRFEEEADNEEERNTI